MGVGNGGQIYKEKAKSEEIHVKKSDQQSLLKLENQNAPLQQTKDDQLQRVMDAYRSEDTNLDVSGVQKQSVDKALPEFQAVKTSLSRLLEVMSAEHVIEKYQIDALTACRQASVRYYNTHRGHRWSGKGKRRKDLVNRLTDAVQSAIVCEDTPKLVKWTVVKQIAEDKSPESGN